ncbi:hypothetical protein V6N12_029502 [Hibiscus sabdariffa]|uniref:Sm domain-containing protein n=1 Tax=Hibiscus sabdariffa TaxID=183260 RepID=A0ABR2CWC9_9ROSI
MLVGIKDGRFFLGTFHCLDKQGNIILQDTVEYRSTRRSSPSPMEQRCLGLILIPSSCRISCHVDCSVEEQLSLLKDNKFPFSVKASPSSINQKHLTTLQPTTVASLEHPFGVLANSSSSINTTDEQVSLLLDRVPLVVAGQWQIIKEKWGLKIGAKKPLQQRQCPLSL